MDPLHSFLDGCSQLMFSSLSAPPFHTTPAVPVTPVTPYFTLMLVQKFICKKPSLTLVRRITRLQEKQNPTEVKNVFSAALRGHRMESAVPPMDTPVKENHQEPGI
jgi:hypothetical protein